MSLSDPQVVAHRGDSHEHAEHTLGAYLRAIEVGVDGLECDVRLTADGHLVCVHDRDLRRVGQARGLVSTMQLAELDALDLADWKNPWADLDDEAPERDEAEGRVLTLRKLLEVVADHDRRIEVAIETKHPTRYAGLVERRLVEMLAEFGWTTADAPVRVMSFSNTALQRVERLAPDLRLVQLFERVQVWPMLRRTVGRSWLLGPGIAMLREHPRLAQRISRAGHEVHVWVVNSPEDLELCRSLGVTAVITDKPGEVLGWLGR